MIGRWLMPDPMGGDVTNPQSLNRYAYALNNPATLTDPSGLDPCNNDPDCEALENSLFGISPEAFGQSNHGSGGGGAYTLDGTPVSAGIALGALQSGAAYVKVPPPLGYIPIGRGDRGECPGCYMDPNSDATWDPQSEAEGWQRNLAFLADFLDGTGPSDRYYEFNSPEMMDMMASQGVMEMRAFNKQEGCRSVNNFNRGTIEAAKQVFTDPNNYTQQQVGAWHAAITNHNGITTYTIMNTASMSSFLLHAIPSSLNGNIGHMRNIYQVFSWAEPSPCQ